MNTSISLVLGTIYTLSEIGLSLAKRARGSQVADRGSLRAIWIVILLSVIAGYSLRGALPALDMTSLMPSARIAGVVLFAAGLIIRWYAIIYLGRFFTVNVAIAANHQLIDSGPYRYIRHPSYTGALMAFLGLGLSIGNWASLAALTLPVFLVFLWRMRVEEHALRQGLGIKYRDYMQRTKRFIPAVY
jgi:protein-S-isoprenylcysteine O-methyltransferase